MASSSSARRRPWLHWEILETHLDEAAFFWVQRALALRSPDYVLAELEEGDEGRLRAHLEGLCLGGEPAARRLLLPGLESDEPERVAAAAWALLAQESSSGLQAVLHRLLESPESRTGLLRALELSERPGLDERLLALAREVEPGLRARLLEVLAFRGVDASTMLERLPPGVEDPDLRVAVLRAVRASPRHVAEPWLRLGLRESTPEVRNAALEAGLVHGSRAAWVAARHCVETNAPEPRPALLALAMGGGPSDLQRLVERVSDPALRAEALWALGFSGRRAAAEAALAVLRQQAEPLAALAFATITGVPLEEVLEPLEEVEEEARAAPEPLAARRTLPSPVSPGARPRVDRVEAWWSEQRERFEAGGRYWHGQPWTTEVLLAALGEAPLHARAILLWELAIRGRGACLLEPETWCHLQRRGLREARKPRLEPPSRAFDGWMTS